MMSEKLVARLQQPSELMPGLPPPAQPGFFVGFDKWQSPYVLEWDASGLAWVALGFNCRKMDASYTLHPHFFVEKRCEGDQVDFIKAHAVLFGGRTEFAPWFVKANGMVPIGA